MGKLEVIGKIGFRFYVMSNGEEIGKKLRLHDNCKYVVKTANCVGRMERENWNILYVSP